MKIISFLIGIFLIIIIAGVFIIRTKRSKLADLLPQELEGWTTDGKDRIYHRNNLYEYIDGGAELYLSYNFKKVLHRIYTAPEQPDILLDLFDMGNSKNAFGVFSHTRETVNNTFGQGSQYTEGLLLFWKDRYYVSVLASPETEESKKAVFTLARHIDDAVKSRGPLPEILSLLPGESLIEESIRYFHHYIWLNSHYFISHENILFINKKTDAVLAKYKDQQNQYLLLLVKYPKEKETVAAYQSFIQNYLPELAGQTMVQIEDSTWTACRRKKNYLVIVFNASEKIVAESMIKRIEQKIEID